MSDLSDVGYAIHLRSWISLCYEAETIKQCEVAAMPIPLLDDTDLRLRLRIVADGSETAEEMDKNPA